MMLREIEGRKVVFRSLVGSHNYGLNDELSDKDYKYFVLPTFNDLYSGERFSTSVVTEEEDYTAHDIRKLGQLLKKSNVNFLETLFSEEIIINHELTRECFADVADIFCMSDRLARANLSYLFDSTMGMFNIKMKLLEKGTAGTMHLIEQFGYDTKQAMASYRLLDFLFRYNALKFTDFKTAINYFDVGLDSTGTKLMDIKRGKYSLDQFKEIIQKKEEEVLKLKDKYKSRRVDSVVFEKLDSKIKSIVKAGIM